MTMYAKIRGPGFPGVRQVPVHKGEITELGEGEWLEWLSAPESGPPFQVYDWEGLILYCPGQPPPLVWRPHPLSVMRSFIVREVTP